MSLFSLLLAITFPWAIIHAIRYFYIRNSRRQYAYGSSILPLPTSSVPSFSHRTNTHFIQSLTNTTHLRMKDGSTFELGMFSMKFETTRWNGLLATIPFLTSYSRSRHDEGGSTRRRRDSTDSNTSWSSVRTGATFGSHTPAFNSEFLFQISRQPQPPQQIQSRSQLDVNTTSSNSILATASTPIDPIDPLRSTTPANSAVTINTTGKFRTLLHRYLVGFYVLGAGVCLVAMALGMLLLTWSTIGVLWGILTWIFGLAPSGAKVVKDGPISKRALDDASAGATDGGSGLHSLIPGVTVPLSDLPILLGALLFSQIIHELGHAYTGTLESLPILSSGFHLHLVIPTFFVSLPLPLRPSPGLDDPSGDNGTTRNLSTPSKLRIATAGAWHNFVTWGILALLGWSTISFTGLFPVNWRSSTLPNSIASPGLGGLDDICLPSSTASSCNSNSNSKNDFVSRGSSYSNDYMHIAPPWYFWSYLGYCDTQFRGPTITHVESSSPLKGHLPVGAIITKLDDVLLGGSDGPAYLQPEKKGKKGVWAVGAFRRLFEYLEMPLEEEKKRIKEDAGWCVPESWFTAQPSECCSSTSEHENAQGSCFNSRKPISKDSENSKTTTKEEGMVERCLDPVPLFTYQHNLQLRASQSANNITQYPRNIGGNLDDRGILVERMNTRNLLVNNADVNGPGVFAERSSAIEMNRRGGTNGNKNGSAYGTRCHVACLRADGDEETYACVRPRINNDEERLIRLEIEDPPWLQQYYSHSPFGSDQEANGNKNPRGSDVPTPGQHTFDDDPEFRDSFSPSKPGFGRGPPPTRVIVFKGPPSEILDHISIDVLRPRSPLFPPARLPMFFRSVLPGLWVVWWEYVSRVSLGLGFFNLLAIQGLDGGWVFGCVVEWWLLRRSESNSRSRRSHRSRGSGTGHSDEIELLERGEGEDLSPSDYGYTYGGNIRGEWNWRTRERIEKTVSVATVGMGVLVTVATVWKDVG